MKRYLLAGFAIVYLAVPSLIAQQNARDAIAGLNTAIRSQLRLQNLVSVRLLLNERAAIFEQAIQANPQGLRALALAPDEASEIAALLPDEAALIETGGEWEGELQILAADDFEHGRSRTLWRVRTTEGTYQLFFGPKGTPARAIAGGTRVRVKGIRLRESIAADIVLAQAPPPVACSTTGQQNIAYLMATMPGGPAFPAAFSAAAIQQAAFATSGISLNDYWKESSYGLTSASGQVFGPFALSQSYTCDQSSALEAAVLQAAAGTVDFTQFTRVAVVFPVSACSYGGLGTVGCQTLPNNQYGSFAWFPIFSYETTYNFPAVIAHEHGHNLGLDHASSADYGAASIGALDNSGTLSEYGDPFSVMGMTYLSNNGQGILGQYSAEHKSALLGWLSAGSGYQEIATGGTYTLAPFESNTGVRALRILRDAATSSWLWLEYRQPIGLIDATFSMLSQPSNLFSGALIHYENAYQDSLHTFLLDFNPAATPNNFYTSALTTGHAWLDPVTPLHLTVLSASSSGLTVAVNYDSQCAAAAPAPSAAPAGTTVFATLSITAPAGCSWTVSASDSWISLTGATSGTGNGSVPYTLVANFGTTQRTGYITVQRQSVAILQLGSGSAVLGAAPNSGSGISAQIAFTFQDPRPGGFSDITAAYINFVGIPGCHIYVGPPSYVELFNDLGQYLPLFIGSGATGSVSNSSCSILAAGTSIVGSGQQLTVTLHLTFAAGYSGSHAITASVIDGSSTTFEPEPVGSWTVPAATGAGAPPLLFVPITPCRIADTRTATGAFGAPSLAGQSTRNFTVPNGACSIPSSAQAYSLNVTVVPPGPLGYLSVWPAGLAQPLVSTLNSDGRVKSNAAIVPAGTGGAISVFASNATDVVLDINGYFVSASTANSLGFYPVTPCRISDTRNNTGSFGGPYISGQSTRTIPVRSSACGLPAAAQAYSLNLTSIPRGPLGYLTVWPTGQPMPGSSSLNAVTGTVTANAAIVLGGTSGSFNVFASNDTDLAIDINGYFAPPGAAGALSLYNVTPCRVLDTRTSGNTLPFVGVINVNPTTSACAVPAAAQAYVFNVTTAPSGTLAYLTMWAQGASQPVVSTLNAVDGTVTGNMAIVPTTSGAISVFATNSTHLILDVFGYFAP